MKHERKEVITLKTFLNVLILIVTTSGIITNVYADHGSHISIQYLTGEESFDRNKDIPIHFSVQNKMDECVLLSNVGIAFDQQVQLLPDNVQKNFTLPETDEIPAKSSKTFTVNIRLHPDTPAGEYTIKVFATAGSCSDPSHGTDVIDGPRLGLTVPTPKSQCIIATATYGSELAPEVQFLRNFRDHTVLSTYSGNNFITLFNAFYYSWSPSVADAIRDNDNLKSISKFMITPLLSILKIGSIAGEHSETGVIASGILSSMLIGAVYVTPLSIGSLAALKRDVKRVHIKYTLITWIAAVILTIGATILHFDTFMMASAGMLVISSIALSAIGLTFAIKRLWYCKKQVCVN